MYSIAILLMAAGCSPEEENSFSSTAENTALREDALDGTVPVLTVTPGTTTYVESSPAVVIDRTLLLTDPGGTKLEGANVSITSGYLPDQDRLHFTPQGGVTGSFNISTGILTLTGSAPAATYGAILRSITYRNIATRTPDTRERQVTYSIDSTNHYSPATGHYYEFVSAPGITWEEARNAAGSRKYDGLKGYLVTITSEAENTFVTSKLQGQGWIGASDDSSKRTWRWVTGPEGQEDNGAGRHFFTQDSDATPCRSGAHGTAVEGRYNNWSQCEPNDYKGMSEDYAHFFTNGTWNDFPLSDKSISGYIVEYGGMPGDPAPRLSGTRPLQVSPAPLYTISLTNGPNGTVSPPGNQTVKQGQSLELTLTPATGYELATLIDNSVDRRSQVVGGKYVLPTINTSHSIVATFTKARGTACESASECLSGNCVDGVCCDSACTGQCEACDAAGSKGTCVPVSGNPHGERPACASDDPKCGGTCDGQSRMSCTYPEATVGCGAESCTNGVQTLAASCNGAGQCAAPETRLCGVYACGQTSCNTTCTSDDACGADAFCVAGACRPKEDPSLWKFQGGGGCSSSGLGSMAGLLLLLIPLLVRGRGSPHPA
ncbi:InlB B-repeat-containing protein [Cystobacter fuscus]|uniref:InlB B-repeat-containing protein n=1 Tax=Cystobacter fuscus TaxID=43 RepID=UPI0005BC8B71|nr:hypothetical protein [Cystobacter fuscus]